MTQTQMTIDTTTINFSILPSQGASSETPGNVLFSRHQQNNLYSLSYLLHTAGIDNTNDNSVLVIIQGGTPSNNTSLTSNSLQVSDGTLR